MYLIKQYPFVGKKLLFALYSIFSCLKSQPLPYWDLLTILKSGVFNCYIQTFKDAIF